MKKRKIVSDSASDILQLEQVDFAYAPMKLITAEREFIDDEMLDIESMVDFFLKYKGKSKSSCPNPNDWIEAFGDADEVFCVTITGGLSGSYNSACAAKKLYEEAHPERRVFVLDSRSAGPEITLTVRKLGELIEAEMPFEEICSAISCYIQNTGLVFMLKSLKNFANNGRVSPLVAKIVGIAGICVVGKASDEGTLEPTHKCRGEGRSLETLIEDLELMGLETGRVSIGHCRNEAGARALENMLHEKIPQAEIEVHPLRGLCSFYAENGGLLVGFEKR